MDSSTWASETTGRNREAERGERKNTSQVNWKHFRVRRSGRQTVALCALRLKPSEKLFFFFFLDERKIERKSRVEWIFRWDDRRNFFRFFRLGFFFLPISAKRSKTKCYPCHCALSEFARFEWGKRGMEDTRLSTAAMAMGHQWCCCTCPLNGSTMCEKTRIIVLCR